MLRYVCDRTKESSKNSNYGTSQITEFEELKLIEIQITD